MGPFVNSLELLGLMFASHKTVLNTQNLNVGWLGWLAGWIYLRSLLLLEHLAVLKTYLLDPNLTSHLSELMRCPTFETDGTLVMRPYVTEEEGGSEIGAGYLGGGTHFSPRY